MPEPAEIIECPRCRRPTLLGQSEIVATGYREVKLEAPKRYVCHPCSLVILRVPDDALGAIDEHLDQQRSKSDLGCSFCLAALDRIILRSAEAWVEIERCPRCHALVLDEGDGPLVRRIVHQSAVEEESEEQAMRRAAEDLSERRANVAGALRDFGMSLEPRKPPSWTAERRQKADAALADLEEKLKNLFER